jgi:hypothetical protein
MVAKHHGEPPDVGANLFMGTAGGIQITASPFFRTSRFFTTLFCLTAEVSTKYNYNHRPSSMTRRRML